MIMAYILFIFSVFFICAGIFCYFSGSVADVIVNSVVSVIFLILALLSYSVENNWLHEEISYDRYIEIKEMPKDILNKHLQDNIITNREYMIIKNDFDKQKLNELKISLYVTEQ